jgi:hypothetical protein
VQISLFSATKASIVSDDAKPAVAMEYNATPVKGIATYSFFNVDK